MYLNMGLALLHRRIEEWTEEALLQQQLAEMEVEAFREYGSELMAYLHERVEEMELGYEELMIPGSDATSGELCEELMGALLDAWERLAFGERPAQLRIDELREVLEALAEVLEAPADDAGAELEEATDVLDDFLASA